MVKTNKRLHLNNCHKMQFDRFTLVVTWSNICLFHFLHTEAITFLYKTVKLYNLLPLEFRREGDEGVSLKIKKEY